MSEENLSNAIRRLYEIVDSLDAECAAHRRHFTLDGHLLGSIGEVYAAERYGIHLYTSSKKAHDGWVETSEGTKRRVQIKVTQTRAKRRVVSLSHKPDYLIVLLVDEEGTFEEVYNGPSDVIWGLVEGKPVPANGQYQISLGKLSRLNVSVAKGDRIQRR